MTPDGLNLCGAWKNGRQYCSIWLVGQRVHGLIHGLMHVLHASYDQSQIRTGHVRLLTRCWV